ncbi:unnamed protein product [Leptidea sinapis]|uniref:Uncharacterized protein n=1 Tax=Leptidea sinapis TaxID=189913 RepID=A0A5E4QDP2_9NEOP|nr:unnamed protein product [Leptidea sinapis]
MNQETRSDSPDKRQETNSKTSFLIEDILYRGQRSSFKKPDTRRFEYDEPKYFQPPSEIRPHVQRDGYLQVAMGALGAYLHTPNAYKADDSRLSTTHTSDSETDHSDSDIDIVGESSYAHHYAT